MRYSPWILQKNQQTHEIKVIGGKRQGSSVVAQIEGIADRDAALALMGSEILISRRQLPKPKDGEYYWADLVGLKLSRNPVLNWAKSIIYWKLALMTC